MSKIINLLKENLAIKAGIGYIIGNFLNKGIVFFTIPIFTRLMTPDQFGLYSIYMTYELILVAIIGLSTHTSIRNGFYDFKNDFIKYVTSLVGLTITGCLISIFILVFTYDSIFRCLRIEPLLLFVLIFHGASDALIYIYNSYLSIYYDFKRYQLLSLVYCICNILISYYLITNVFTVNTSVGRIYGTAIPLIIIGIVVVIYFIKRCKSLYNFNYWKYAAVYSVPLIPHALSQVLLTHFNRIIIQRFFDNMAAGLFSFSAIFNNVFLVISSSLTYSYNTWFYENMEKNNYIQIKKVSALYVYGFSILVSILLLSSTEVTMMLAPETYQESIYCTIPLLVSAFFAAIYTLPSQVEYYYKKTQYISFGTLLATFLNIIMSLLLVPRYGYVSAAYINLFTYIIYFAFHYYFAYRIKKYNFLDAKAILISSLFCMAIAVYTRYFLDNIYLRWGLLLTMVIIIFLYFFIERKSKLI